MEALTKLPGLEVVALEQEDHTKALESMKQYSLDYEGSLHLVTAMRMRATKIVSNDKDLDKTPLKRIF